MYPSKLFVREKGEPHVTKHSANVPYNPLHGIDVRNFYEEIISTVPEAKPQITPETPRIQIQKKSVETVDQRDIFKVSENNNIELLYKLVASGINVNQRDAFGWTSLMCAACSGAEKSVRILLAAGADRKARDPGYDALYLAKKRGHSNIVKLLTRGLSPPKNIIPSVEKAQSVTHYCELCKNTFKTNRSKHEASLVHLLAVDSAKPKTFYGIPESNRGFQLLVKHGWDRERGLGPEGSGRKFPVKASQKKDRSGVGAVTKSLATDEKTVMKNLSQIRHSSKMLMEDPKKSLEYLKQLELKGDEIIRDRQEIVALDIRRNEAREGLRALQKSDEEKTFMSLGPMLIKIKKSQAEELLKKDVVQVDTEINKIRSNLKVKVNELRDMEHQSPVPGLMLKAMEPAELQALGRR